MLRFKTLSPMLPRKYNFGKRRDTLREVLRLLDARGAISVTERARFIGRVRNLARAVASAYYERREVLGFPMCETPNKTGDQS